MARPDWPIQSQRRSLLEIERVLEFSAASGGVESPRCEIFELRSPLAR